jgi:hypothetical protein
MYGIITNYAWAVNIARTEEMQSIHTSAFGNTRRRILNVSQHFGDRCNYYLGGYCLGAGGREREPYIVVVVGGDREERYAIQQKEST